MEEKTENQEELKKLISKYCEPKDIYSYLIFNADQKHLSFYKSKRRDTLICLYNVSRMFITDGSTSHQDVYTFLPCNENKKKEKFYSYFEKQFNEAFELIGILNTSTL